MIIMDYNLTECQIKNIDAIVRNGGLEFPELFAVYTSGKIGPYYIQSTVVLDEPQSYQDAIDSIIKLISDSIGDNFDNISGGATRDWPFSAPVAYSIPKPYTILYKEDKIIGADMNSKTVVHVADLNNQGSSVRDMWAPKIRKVGGTINDVFFFVDRMEVEGIKAIKEAGLKSHAVVKLNESAWDYLLETEKITSHMYDSLIGRIKNPEKWAEDMLLSPKGLQKMNELLHSADDSVRTKARKILNTGYPHIKNDILIGIENL